MPSEGVDELEVMGRWPGFLHSTCVHLQVGFPSERTLDDPNQKLRGITIYFARMMIGHLPTYTNGEFETAVAAINEAIIDSMADQSSSGESDLYTLPILCLIQT